MKYLVLLVVLVVAIGIWRSRRAGDAASTTAPPPRAPALPQDMLACARCGVHVPQAEALLSGNHAYCCAEHQRMGPA
jgi:uncharacterized protein